MTKRRILKWLAGLGGLCVILLFAAALLLPRVLDSQAAKEKIYAFLLTRINGNVVIGNVDLKWFPRLAIVAQTASLSVADKVSGKIQSIEVYPSIRGLLIGRFDISRVKVVRPAVVVRLPEWTEEPFNIDEIESGIRSAVAALASAISGTIVTVTSGSAEVRVGDRPPVLLTDFAGRLGAPASEIDLQISSHANIFDSLRVTGKIAGDNLATNAHISIQNLKLRESVAALWPRSPEYVQSGELNLDLGLTAVGVKKIKAEISGALPSLELVRENRKTVIGRTSFKASIGRDEGIIKAVIERLDLVSPRLTATGELTVDPASSSRLKLVGKSLDVSQVRESVFKIAGDIGLVEDIFRHVTGGQIPEISFQATARSFADLWRNIDVTGSLRRGNIFASVLGIDLTDVSGQFVVSRGVLEAKQFSARSGKIHGRDGTLRLGLEGQSAPFHLDMMAEADAAELRSLLLRLIKNGRFQQELSRISNVEGEVSGRLILGEKIDSLSPNVSISKTAVSGSYGPIPYPISIKEGRFHYGDGKIALEGVGGAIGLSSFSDLTGSVNYNDSRQIEISSGKFSLDLAQTKNLQNRFAEFPKVFGDIEFVRGRLDLISLSLKGPLDEPSRWDYASSGTLGKIAVKHTKLPAVMNLSGGKFSATPAKLTFSSAKVGLLDASLIVDGSLESPDRVPLGLEAAATGSIGAEMTGWLSRQIELPKQLVPRSPLQLARGRVLWKKDGNVAFRATSPSLTVLDFRSIWFGVLMLWKLKRSLYWMANSAPV
jgi:hypothetical protein